MNKLLYIPVTYSRDEEGELVTSYLSQDWVFTTSLREAKLVYAVEFDMHIGYDYDDILVFKEMKSRTKNNGAVKRDRKTK